jgi:hypothetical protein
VVVVVDVVDVASDPVILTALWVRSSDTITEACCGGAWAIRSLEGGGPWGGRGVGKRASHGIVGGFHGAP